MFTSTCINMLQPSVPAVTAQVSAHELYHPPLCTALVSDGVTVESQCWGAHVSFVYPWEGTVSRTCTITSAVPEVHTKTDAQRILLESYAMASSHAVYPHPAPTLIGYGPIGLVMNGAVATVWGCTFVAALADMWEKYGAASFKLWWQHRWGLPAGGQVAGGGTGGTAIGGGGGGNGGGGGGAWRVFVVGKKTDNPLVASALLP